MGAELPMGKEMQMGKGEPMEKELPIRKQTGTGNVSGAKGMPSRRKKVLCAIYVAMAFIMISLPLASMPFKLDREGYEKRALSEMPRLFGEGESALEFPSRFDTYFSENFGLRSYMITLYSGLVYNLTGDSVNDKVIAGKDGWLFFHETLDDYTNGSELGPDMINLLYRSLYLQCEYLSERGIGFIFMAAPNKNSIYGEYMPQRYRKSPSKTNLELLNECLSSGSVPFINLQELLITNKDGQQLYHRKDTHWNNYGAMLAYREIMRKTAGLVGQFGYADYEDTSYAIEKNWEGDLEAMLFPAFPGKDYQVVFDKEPTYRFIRPMRTYEDMLIETVSTVNDKRLLMFRDSFANALIPFLSDAFGYACYSRAVPFNYSLIERADPDIVIVEIAERNLPRLLDTAPLMPAPQRQGLPVNLKTTEKISAAMAIDREGQYVKIHGNIFSAEPLTGISEIYVSLFNETGRYDFEAFPVLNRQEENAGFENVSPVGFSMLLDEKGIPAGEYEIRVALKTEQGYMEPFGEGIIHSFQ